MNKKLLKTLSAILAGAMILSGCGEKPQNEDGPTTISWYVPSLITGDAKDEVYTKINEILAEKYNLQLEVVAVDSANYDQRMQVMNAGRDEYDLAYTAHWQNNYLANVTNNVFWEITEEDLKKYAPKTYASMNEDAWNATRVNGKIYAVPNWQMYTRASAVYAPQEYLDLTGTDVNSLKDYDAITEYLKKLHAVKPEVTTIGKLWSQFITHHNMVEVYEEKMPGVVDFTVEGKPIVFNQYESQDFADYVATRNMWIEEGLASSVYNPNSKDGEKEFKKVPLWGNQYSPMGVASMKATYKYDINGTNFSDILLTPSGITAALTGISSTSKHPTEALKMIEIMNTDSEIMNLLAYGIEGVNYDKVSDNTIKLKEDNTYTGPALYQIGSMANAYLVEGQSPTLIEDMKKHNDSARPSPLLGFNAKLDNLTLQISNCKTVINEYIDMLDLGIYGPDKLAEFNKALKDAGVDVIITELQKQIDEWYATK